MALFDILTTSTSGMAAQAALLSTIGNNIANVDTTGYKQETSEFSSLVLDTGIASDYASGSVQVDPQVQVDGQGAINATTNPTDLAVKGNGFFIVQGPNDQPVLTRVGSFTENSSGELVNAAGYVLLGYPTGTSAVANSFTGLVPVNVKDLSLQAAPTTLGKLYLNLPSTATPISAADLPSAAGASNPTTATPTDITSASLRTTIWAIRSPSTSIQPMRAMINGRSTSTTRRTRRMAVFLIPRTVALDLRWRPRR